MANRLGGSAGPGGAVARFDAREGSELDFTTDGLTSVMAVARDPNVSDDTPWVTSGAGTRGIHGFDVSDNLLRSVLPADVPEGDDLVPQGIAFANDGRLYVVSFDDAVFEFDGEGNCLFRFPTGAGTSRSTAFRRCDGACADSDGGDSSLEAPSGETGDAPAVDRGSGGGGALLRSWRCSSSNGYAADVGRAQGRIGALPHERVRAADDRRERIRDDGIAPRQRFAADRAA